MSRRPRRLTSSAMSSPMEAVQQKTVVCRSTMISQCMSRFPGSHWNGHGPEALAPELEPDAGRPEAVPHGDLHPVLPGKAGHLVAAGEHVGPVPEVLFGVAEDFSFSGGPGRGMNPDHVLEGDREKRERISFPKVVRGGERELPKIFQGGDIPGLELLPRSSSGGRRKIPHRRAGRSTSDPLAESERSSSSDFISGMKLFLMVILVLRFMAQSLMENSK